MPTARVMFVMPVSCVIEVEVPDGTDTDDAIAVAFQELPGFTDQHWDSADPTAYDHDETPFMVEIED